MRRGRHSRSIPQAPPCGLCFLGKWLMSYDLKRNLGLRPTNRPSVGPVSMPTEGRTAAARNPPTGERRRTDYRLDTNRQTIDESFEIKVRNHKKEPVDIRVVEHLYRWITWDISAKSDSYRRTDK